MSQSGTFVKSGITPITPVETLTGNNPVAVGPDGSNNINIKTNNATVTFFGNAGTNTLTEDFGLSNLILGSNALGLSSGLGNVGLGDGVLNAITSGSSNTGIGVDVLQNITTQSSNTAVGFNSLDTASSATNNTALGYATLSGASTANSNIAIGYQAILNATNPNNNIAIGTSAGSAWTTTEANNLILYNAGVIGDANTIRIGTQGAGAGQQNKVFVAGIIGVTVPNPSASVVVDTITGQLGVGPGGNNPIEMIAGNDAVAESPVLGLFHLLTSNATVKFLGSAATETLNFGLSNLILGDNASAITAAARNVGFGNLVFHALTSGTDNIAVGSGTLQVVTSGSGNTGVGSQALNAVIIGSNNTAVGDGALGLATGSTNNAFGFNSLINLTSGANNTAIGQSSGSALTTESNNLFIYNAGTVADANTIRIGTQGAGAGQQNKCFMAGIIGVSPSNPQTVGIDSVTGQLGVIAGGGPAIETLTGDTGGPLGPTAGNFNIIANVATLNAGSSVLFAGAGSTLTLDVTDSNNNTFIGKLAGNATLTSIKCISLGAGAGSSLTSGNFNNFLGYQAGQSVTNSNNNNFHGYQAGWKLSGPIGDTNNTAIGTFALWMPASCVSNTAIGSGSLQDANWGSFNTALGHDALGAAPAASSAYNLALGYKAGFNNSSTLGSSNIYLNCPGTNADANILRIGAGTGAGNQQLAAAYICGVDGVNVGSVAKVVTMASDQLGTATITAGTGVSVVPTANTITINSVGGGVTWTVIAANQTAAVNNGYFCNKAGTLTLALPAASAVGDVIEVTNENTALGVQFTQAAGQQILLPNNTSTTLGATGTLTSSAIGDTMKIVCKVANTIWRCTSMNGNFTPA